MSKMSDLATVLDDLTQIGKALATCGEDLIRAAALVKDCFSKEETQQESVKPVATAEQKEPAAEKTKQPSKEEVRARLADLSQASFRAEAKALVKKYGNGGSFSDIDPASYADLMEEAKKYHA